MPFFDDVVGNVLRRFFDFTLRDHIVVKPPKFF